MELDDFKGAWKELDAKLDSSLKLNAKVLEELNKNKAKSKMNGLLAFRIVEALIFLILLGALWGFAYDNLDTPAPALSAGILGLFSLIGLIGSIGQIALIGMIDYSTPILDIQQSLARIRTHAIQLARLMILTIPFYMAYIFLGFYALAGVDLYQVANPAWFYGQVAFSVLLVIPVLWLARELRPGRKTGSRVQRIMDNLIPGQLNAAAELIHEMESFNNE